MIKLYDLELSANAYKARLFMAMMGIDYELVPVDMVQGEHKSPEYLKLNVFGQVPTLIDGGVIIRDSQAILVYLARKFGKTEWWPTDAEGEAKVVGWLSFAANEVFNGPAVARAGVGFKMPGIDVERAQKYSGRILKVLDQHLIGREWLELGRPTIGDLAVYPYVALAPEGGVRLAERPNVVAWVKRVEALPGWVPMPGLPYKGD